jgi:predicted extracellular nuclease
VYGGAGCTTAGCSTYKNDYIELFNRGTTPVSLNGWSVQHAAATGPASGPWAITSLTNVTLQPGQYYLVSESGNANGVSSLPTPDATGSISMSATAGKVALVNSTTGLTGTCPATSAYVDLVGYGSTANCSESAPAPAPGTATAALRKSGGCTDTDNNAADFAIATPSPRNTNSPLSPCGGASSILSLVSYDYFLRPPGIASSPPAHLVWSSRSGAACDSSPRFALHLTSTHQTQQPSK